MLTRSVLFLLAQLVASHACVAKEGMTTARISELGGISYHELSDQIEGRPLDIRLRLINDTSLTFEKLQTNVVCKCISATFEPEQETPFGPADEIDLKVTIVPSRNVLREQVDILATVAGKEGEPSSVRITSVAFAAICHPPLRPDHYYYPLDERSTANVKLIPADPAITISDIEKVTLDSDYLEIRSIDRKADGYLVEIGPKEGTNTEKSDIFANLTAPFVVNGKSPQLMAERLTFVREHRIEVAPKLIRFRSSPSQVPVSFRNASARIIVRDFSPARGGFHPVLITRREDSVVLLDPDLVTGIKKLGKSNAYQLSLSGTICEHLLDKSGKIWVAFHQENSPLDLSLPWESFSKQYDVFPATID